MAPLIEYRGVAKRFGDHVVLRGVDFSVERGEVMVLMGASGSGKTLLLRMLVGLEQPDEGVVRFEGRDVATLDRRELRALRRRIGFVFQASALFDSLDVEDNVGYALAVERPRAEKANAARVAECLSLVGLDGTSALKPSELSGGMRKRVAIARALATGPEALLYDEPTVGLDPGNVRRIGELIARLGARLGVTALVVTHDEALAFLVATRVGLLAGGRVAWQGAVDEARARPPAALRAFLEGTGEAAP